ncbi:MAG TPA: SusC/RagA family protein, partial [Chitinophagaceae bacterium]|nr:SusC/RagA family protein [Chitinophagaceae bacterium]
YGSRASNGVIIVTTKKGKSGKIKFNFSTQYSMSVLPKKADIFTGDQIRDIVLADYIARGSNDSTYLRLLGNANTDWQDEVYDNASTSDNNLSMSGAYKNVPYRLSLGYLSQDGILRTGNLKRTSASLSVAPRFFDEHLKVDLNVKGSIGKSRFADEGAIGNAVRFDPTKPVFSTSKRFGGFFEWEDPSSTTGLRELSPLNPVGLLEQKTDKSDVLRSIGNIQFDYKLHFFPDLRVNLNLGYDVSKGEGTVFIPDSAASSYKRSPDAMHGGVDNSYLQKKSNTLLETYLNYVKEIKSIYSKIDAMAGYSYQDYSTTIYNGELDPNGVRTDAQGNRW